MSRLTAGAVALCCLLLAGSALAQEAPAAPQPSALTLKRLVVEGATVFNREDVEWLLHLRTGTALPGTPGELATRLERLYSREGYSSVRVSPVFDDATGTLTLKVDEPRLDELEFRGANAELETKLRAELEHAGVRPGEPYNDAAAARAVRRAIAITNGAFRLGKVALVDRDGRRVLQVPVARRQGDFSTTTGTDGREDIYNPVDGFSPSLGFHGIAYDRSGFNYTFVSGFASWKFGRDDAGFSLGVERPLMANTRMFVGVEMHDLTASDDRWRVAGAEQSLAAVFVGSSFRDYYRRRGVQAHAGFRPTAKQEVLASVRWDRHEPLENTTEFNIFRRGRDFRPNPLVADADVHALVLAYTFDSRGLDRDTIAGRYERHLVDDLFRGVRRSRPGWRADWTSEIAGRGLGGDHAFTRHILNARAVTRLAPHQSIAVRGLFGWSDGTLPLERRFALGGIGSVRGYGFKEAVGTGFNLVNAEYSLHLEGREVGQPGSLALLVFFDAGKVRGPIEGSGHWMRGIGAGLQTGPIRFEWGSRLDDIGGSNQFLVRLGRSF